MFDTLEIKEVKIELGLLLRTIRKKRKLSQTELADSLDVSRNTIQNLESGKNFTADTFFKILKQLDLLDRVYTEIQSASAELSQTKSLY